MHSLKFRVLWAAAGHGAMADIGNGGGNSRAGWRLQDVEGKMSSNLVFAIIHLANR